MHWFVVHTKPRQELRALQNLQNQGYACFLPRIRLEKIKNHRLSVIDEPLFPRYLFVRFDAGAGALSWGPIRSTLGVSSLVRFGLGPARVDDALLALLRQKNAVDAEPKPLFTPGEQLAIHDGPFVGLHAVYQMADGEQRAMVLIELLSKPVRLRIAPASLRRVQSVGVGTQSGGRARSLGR